MNRTRRETDIHFEPSEIALKKKIRVRSARQYMRNKIVKDEVVIRLKKIREGRQIISNSQSCFRAKLPDT